MAIGVDGWIRRFGKGRVHEPAIGHRRFAVDHRAYERMAEPELCPDVEQACRGRCPCRVHGNAESLSGGRDQDLISDRLGGGHEQQPLGLIGQGRQAPAEALFDPT
jgi:hypothetical protein